MALKHFLFTIPLGSLLTTLAVTYLLPSINYDLAWHELYILIVSINVVVTILAYVLMPSRGLTLRRS